MEFKASGMGVIWLLQIVALLHHVTSQGTMPPHDCRTNGCDMNARCSFSDGTCQCPNEEGVYYDHRCNVLTDNPCRSNCVMDHTYQTDGGAALCGQGRCACTENYTGDICEQDRLKVLSCVNGVMRFRMMPHPTAGRSVFYGTTFLNAVNDFSTFPTSPCSISSSATHNIAIEGGPDSCFGTYQVDSTYKVYAYVRYQPYVTSADHIVSVQCTEGGLNTLLSTSLANVEAPTDFSTSTTITLGQDPITMSIVKNPSEGVYEDILIGDVIRKGDPLSIRFMYAGDLFNVRTIQAYNYDPSAPDINIFPNRQSFTMLSAGCVIEEQVSLFRNIVAWNTGLAPHDPAAAGGEVGKRLMRFDIRAFQFTGDRDEIHFTASVCRECPGPPGNPCKNDISSVQMQNAFPLSRRRRRAADDEAPEAVPATVNMAISMKINDGQVQDVSITTKDPSADKDGGSCYKEVSVLLPLVLLVCLLLVSMVMSFCFCYRLTQRKDKHEHANAAFKG